MDSGPVTPVGLYRQTSIIGVLLEEGNASNKFLPSILISCVKFLWIQLTLKFITIENFPIYGTCNISLRGMKCLFKKILNSLFSQFAKVVANSLTLQLIASVLLIKPLKCSWLRSKCAWFVQFFNFITLLAKRSA